MALAEPRVHPSAALRRTPRLWAWLFQRVSGPVLFVLALGHVAWLVVFRDVGDLTYADVVARWSSGLWRAWDWLLLVGAIAHGVIGGRSVVEDHVRGARGRFVAVAVLVVTGAVLLSVGTVVTLTVG